MLRAFALPDDRSDDPRALPKLSPGMAKSLFRRLLRRTGLLSAAPAEEEPPEEEVCTAGAGARPAGTSRLDGTPDDECRLPAPAADGVVFFFGRPPARRFLLRPLPLEPLSPDIALFRCALVLPPSILLPPPPPTSHCALRRAAGGRWCCCAVWYVMCKMCWCWPGLPCAVSATHLLGTNLSRCSALSLIAVLLSSYNYLRTIPKALPKRGLEARSGVGTPQKINAEIKIQHPKWDLSCVYN